MMPWASNRIANEETLFERRAVVRADGPDCEYLIAAPGQEHRLAQRMPEQHGSIRDRSELDALGEIGPAEFGLFFTHTDILEAELSFRSDTDSNQHGLLRETSAIITLLIPRPT
jgi:hypothetical protein